MPRISKEAAAAKQSFVLGLYATNPTLTMKEVQEQVKAQFGGAMNAVKILELKNSLLNKDSPIVLAGPEPTPATLTEAHVAEAFPTEVLTVNHVDAPVEPLKVTSILTAPKPLAAEPPGEVTVRIMEQVTTADGTFVREPQPPKQGEEVQIVKGLVEVK
jgi:hypothetical protein